MILPTTAGALDGGDQPLIYQVRIDPGMAQVVHDTGVAATVADAGYGIPDRDLAWLVGANAEMVDVVSNDIAVRGYACGEVGMAGSWDDFGDWAVLGASYSRC